MQAKGDSHAAPVNPGGPEDGLVLAVLLLGVSGPATRALGRGCAWVESVFRHLPESAPGPAGAYAHHVVHLLLPELPHGCRGPFVLFVILAILLLVSLRRDVLGRVTRPRLYNTARAAFMALAGVPVAFVAAVSLLSVGTAFADEAGLEWLAGLTAFLAFCVPSAVAGLWSGWRFGRWGCAWALAGLLLVGLLLGGPASLLPRTLREAVWGAVILGSSALGGWLGARLFQRSQRRHPAAPQRSGDSS